MENNEGEGISLQEQLLKRRVLSDLKGEKESIDVEPENEIDPEDLLEREASLHSVQSFKYDNSNSFTYWKEKLKKTAVVHFVIINFNRNFILDLRNYLTRWNILLCFSC